MTVALLLILLAYLLGSVNFAIVLFRLAGKPDPRTNYSGNAGATNVYRQSGWAWALVVFGLAFFRTMGLIWLSLQWVSPGVVIWIGLALLVGNRFPCFHGFKGGKGVADYCGVTLPLAPLTVIFGALGWLVTMSVTRQPFMASLVLTPILGMGTLIQFSRTPSAVIGVLLTIGLIIINHYPNIKKWWQNRFY